MYTANTYITYRNLKNKMCSNVLSPPQKKVSMILGLSIFSILSLRMIPVSFLMSRWCTSQNLAPIWFPHWPPWIETSSRMAVEIESKSERGDWEIGLCQKENTRVTCVTTEQHTRHPPQTLATRWQWNHLLISFRVGPVGLMELWRVVHREEVCFKWAALFPLLTWWPFSSKDKWSERRSSCLAGSRQIKFRSRQDRDVHRHAKDCNC